jgi:hypothetical protein
VCRQALAAERTDGPGGGRSGLAGPAQVLGGSGSSGHSRQQYAGACGWRCREARPDSDAERAQEVQGAAR